jgi:glycosyltransferase involved in cell wall biosynthesis
VLYLFHKSLTEPIPRLHGIDQVLALAAKRSFTVASFEPSRRTRSKSDLEAYNKMCARLAAEDVRHVVLPVIGSRWIEIPLGALVLLTEVLFHGVRIVHSRSYIPAVMALPVVVVTRARLVFDMRGLFVDEYIFEGALKHGTRKLTFVRWLERTLIGASDAVVVVSQRFRDHLLSRPDLIEVARDERITVIPNRVDLKRFTGTREPARALRKRLGWEHNTVVVYAGSTAPWHRLRAGMGIVRRIADQNADVRLLIVAYPSTLSAEELALEVGLSSEHVHFVTAPVEDVPVLLSTGDAGLMLEADDINRKVCAPIKFAEYLAAGLAVIGSDGIGDTDHWIREGKIGIIIDPDNEDDAARRVGAFLESEDFRSGAVRERCIAYASEELDMQATLKQYDDIYRELDRA